MYAIFRVRPANKKTVEELEEQYLWFSRPTEYNDKDDANIFAFVKANESIESGFKRLYRNYPDVAKHAQLAGICCFTEEIPEADLV